jgi:CrcB protein
MSPLRSRHWEAVAAVAVGGVLGAEARYGLQRAIPHSRDGFPWATVIINVVGCLLIGMLMALLLELTSPHRLVRPFLGVGVLGGFTTFSTFDVDVTQLVADGRAHIALGYIAVTLVGCTLAVTGSTVVTQLIGTRILATRRRAWERHR